MKQELKDGQIVGIVSGEAFPGADMDIEISQVVDGDGGKHFPLKRKNADIFLTPSNVQQEGMGIQYTFWQLREVLDPGKK